jgi:hypothetical protein
MDSKDEVNAHLRAIFGDYAEVDQELPGHFCGPSIMVRFLGAHGESIDSVRERLLARLDELPAVD